MVAIGQPLWAQETEAPARPPLLPENISTYGHRVDNLFILILVITSIVGIGVLALMGYSLVKFRHKDGRRATFTHGSNNLEIGWTVATAAVLIFIAFAQKSAWSLIKQTLPKPEEAYTVRVFAEQFAWHFVYPGADGKFETNRLEDIYAGFNPLGLADPSLDVVKPTLVVPVNTPVILEMHSLGKYDRNAEEGKRETPGVLHSFFSANLRLKNDVVPYMTQRIWFEATKVGTYEIVCAELCGLGHYQMGAALEVKTSAEVSQALGYEWKPGVRFPGEEVATDAGAAGTTEGGDGAADTTNGGGGE